MIVISTQNPRASLFGMVAGILIFGFYDKYNEHKYEEHTYNKNKTKNRFDEAAEFDKYLLSREKSQK